MRSANKVGIWEACVQFEAVSNCKSFQLQKSATNLFQESTSLSVWVSETRTHPNCLQILVFTGQRTFWNTSKFNLNQDFYLLKIRWNFRNPWSRSTTPEIHGQSQDKVQRQLVGSIEMKGEWRVRWNQLDQKRFLQKKENLSTQRKRFGSSLLKITLPSWIPLIVGDICCS